MTSPRSEASSSLASPARLHLSDLEARADATEQAAWADLLVAAPPRLGASLGLSVTRTGRVVVLNAAGVDSLLFNRTIGSPESPDELDAALARRGRHAPYWVHVDPERRPILEPQLRAHHLEPYPRRLVRLARGAGPLPPASTGSTVRPLAPEDATRFAEVFSSGLDLTDAAVPLIASATQRPGWRAFGAHDGPHLVASALLFVHEATGYLVGAATTPSHRRRGAQRALIVARMRAAFEAGCTLVFAETGAEVPGQPQSSYRNLVRCGFAPVGEREHWCAPGTRWTRAHGASAQPPLGSPDSPPAPARLAKS